MVALVVLIVVLGLEVIGLMVLAVRIERITRQTRTDRAWLETRLQDLTTAIFAAHQTSLRREQERRQA